MQRIASHISNRRTARLALLGFCLSLMMGGGMTLGAKPALAACTSPTGAAGDFVYNAAQKKFQYCNDTSWVAVNSGAGAGTGSCTNPAGTEGQIVYNAASLVLQGCAGNEWHALGPIGGPAASGYQATPIHFDGATRLQTGADLTGVTDTKQVTGSFWFRKTADFATSGFAQNIYDSATNGFRITFDTNDRLRLLGNNASGTSILSYSSVVSYNNDRNWHHVLFSFDLNNSSNRSFYFDGASLGSWSTYTNDVLDTSNTNHIIGGNLYFYGDLADVWIDPGTYIDFSVQANREKFVKNGKPVDLGANGSGPTGTAPKIFLSGALAGWATNKGSGGGFTTSTGALSAGSGSPDLISLNTGLVGHWKLDDGTGLSATDSASSYDGTLENIQDPSIKWVQGKMGNALSFDGIDDYIDITPGVHPTSLPITISAWVRPELYTPGQTIPIFASSRSGNKYEGVWIHIDTDTQRLEAHFGDGDNQDQYGRQGKRGSVAIPLNQWTHVAAVIRGENNINLYINSVEDTGGSYTGNGAAYFPGTGSSRIGENRPGIQRYFPGAIDDVRIYDRALKATEIAALYQSCTSPAAFAPSMIYNAASRAMQYCTDNGWVKMFAMPACTPHCGGRSDEKVAFWTDGSWSGYLLGGVSGAHDKCQAAADIAGLKGTYKAWIANSNPASAPASHFTQSTVPYVRTDGTAIANNWADLTDGTLAANLSVTEYKSGTASAPGQAVSTNVNPDGTQGDAADAYHCQNWSLISGTSYIGHRGNSNSNWTNYGTQGCSTTRHLYCFEQ